MLNNLSFRSLILAVVILAQTQLNAQEIKLISTEDNQYTYAVQPSPEISYVWKTSEGSITNGQNTHSITITSDCRPKEVSVEEFPVFKAYSTTPEAFGAIGNDDQDDTLQLQAAIDDLKLHGGGTLQLAADQTYIVHSIVVYEGICLKGNNALLTRPDYMPKWTQTITTEKHATYPQDSRPILITGLILDGNAKNQGPFRNWEQQHSHLLFIAAGMRQKNPSETGRVKVFVENCLFRNGVADAISQYVNADVTVRHCTAENVFRGGYVCTGGNSIARVIDLTTKATDVVTGIDIEVDGAGYGDNYKIDVWIDRADIQDGDFDVSMMPGSRLVVSNSKVRRPPVTLDLRDSNALFHHCELTFSSRNSLSEGNYVLFPSRLWFVDTQFTLKADDPTCIGACLFVRNNSGDVKNKHLYLHFENCEFQVVNKPPGSQCYGIAFFRDGFTESNMTIYRDNAKFAPEYDLPLAYAYLNKNTYCESSFREYECPNSTKSNENYQNFYAKYGKDHYVAP